MRGCFYNKDQRLDTRLLSVPSIVCYLPSNISNDISLFGDMISALCADDIRRLAAE